MQECLPSLHEKGITTVLLSASLSHANAIHLGPTDSDPESDIGLTLESSSGEEGEEFLPLEPKSGLFSPSGIHYGTREELASLLQSYRQFTNNHQHE